MAQYDLRKMATSLPCSRCAIDAQDSGAIMAQHFLAYSSRDTTHADTIRRAASNVSSPQVTYTPWATEDASASPVGKAVEAWIDDAEAVVADITFVNDNVTYEIGYAIGAQKDLRLIYNSSIQKTNLKQIGLFDTLINDGFRTRADLESLLRDRAAPKNKWPLSPRNSKQPVYVLTPAAQTPLATRLLSALKKQTRYKFRSFSSWEIGRLTAQDAWDQVSGSFGVVATWQDSQDLNALRNNQRAMLILGMARALRIPTLFLVPDQSKLPADVTAQATLFYDISQFDRFLFDFRDEIQDALIEFPEGAESPPALLNAIHCGDAQAENEQESLKLYFLETEESGERWAEA
jgi:hypothetical protein